MALVYAAAGWYASDQIIDGLQVTGSPTPLDAGGALIVDVVSVSDGQVVLDVPDNADRKPDEDALMGLRWADGYAHVGPAVAVDGSRQTRPITSLEGGLPPVGAKVAELDPFAYPRDPSDLGIAFEDVTYPGPMGDLSGWLVPGTSKTWIIAVHGRGADQAEFLRMIDTVRDLGQPILVVKYRNDAGSPRTDDSLILAGQQEWADVAAAVDFAQTRGAEDVVLAGFSMGGALALSYALRAPDGLVRGIVLEAPVSDLREVIRMRSGEVLPVRGRVRDALVAAGLWFAERRTGLDFDEVDYTGRAAGFDVPILLFHGTDDLSVPYVIGEQFRDARPDLVEFYPVPDGGHVRAWNEDRSGYVATLRSFLARIGNN